MHYAYRMAAVILINALWDRDIAGEYFHTGQDLHIQRVKTVHTNILNIYAEAQVCKLPNNNAQATNKNRQPKTAQKCM